MTTIRLRPLEREDLKQMRNWRNQMKDAFREYRPLNMANQEQWFDSLTNDRKTVMWGIEGQTGRMDKAWAFIGVCGWTYIDWHTERHAELSIYVAPKWQGKGYGKAVLEEMHRIAFYEWGLQTVRLEVYSYNAAQHLYRAVGYKDAGVWRNAHYHAGRWWDSILMDYTIDDYLESHPLPDAETNPL